MSTSSSEPTQLDLGLSPDLIDDTVRPHTFVVAAHDAVVEASVSWIHDRLDRVILDHRSLALRGWMLYVPSEKGLAIYTNKQRPVMRTGDPENA